ncbi:MAG: TolC family protein [Abitibacteriaceae bacterium]|nr:TolC family protein [Abditibacteriaceae bacterium]
MKKKDKKHLLVLPLAALQLAAGLEELPVLAQTAPTAPAPTAPPLTVPPTNPIVGAPAVAAPEVPAINPAVPAVPTAPGTPSVAATAVPQPPLPAPPVMPASIADARNTASEQTPPLLLEEALVLALETSPQRAAARAALAAAQARVGTARSAGGLQLNLGGSAQLTHNVNGGFSSFGSTSSSGGLNGGVGTGGTGTGGTGTGSTGTGGTGVGSTGTGGTGGIGTGTGGVGTGTGGTGTGGIGTGTGGTGTGTGGTGGIGIGAGGTGTGGIGSGTGNPVQNVSFAQPSANGSGLRRNATTGTTGGGTTGGTNTGNTGTSTGFANHSESLSLSATYPLYNGGRVKASTREAQYAALAQAAQTLQTESDILLATTNDYLAVLRAGQLLDVTESNLNVAQERRRVAGVRYTAGAAARLEVLTADTVLADAIQRRIAASDSLAQSKAALNTLIGRVPETPLRVEPIASLLPRIPMMIGTGGTAVATATAPGGVDTASGPGATTTTPLGTTTAPGINNLTQTSSAELRALSDKSRASLQAAQQQVNVAQAGVDLAKAQRRPNIGLSLTGLLNNPISAFVKRFGALLGLNVAQSLIDSGRTKSQIAEARALLDQSQNNLQLQRINLYSQIEQALLAFDSAQKSVASADTAVASAQEAVRAAQLGYTAGVRTSLDVSDAQNNLLQAQTNAVNARFDAAIAQVLLASSVGISTEAGQTAYERALREEAQRVLATQPSNTTKVSRKKRR